MAKNLPGLVIKIGANTQDAIAGLNKVNRAVGQAGNAADKSAAKWSQFKKVFAGLGVGAGIAVTVNQLQAMATAAAEDEKSVVSLQKALSNVGLGTAADEAEAFVKQLMLATGVADSDLRQSLQTLTTATGDFEQSQRLVRVAMDASTATGKDLATVSLAIAKATQGNIGALTRLGIPLDAGIVKSKDFAAALKIMEDRFSGQAAAAADTYAGKMKRVNEAVAEAQETIGYELLASLDAVSQALGGTDGAINGVTSLGEEAAAAIRPLREIADTIGDLTGGIDLLGGVMQATVNTLGGPFTSAWMRWGNDLRATDAEQGAFSERLGDIQQHFMDLAVDAGVLGRDYELLADDTDTVTRSTTKAVTALERLQGQMDKMAANRSITGQRINLAEMRSKGPDKGENVRQFALGYADQASSLAADIAERGGFSRQSKARARKVLANARGYLGNLGLGDNFTDTDGAYLGTPAALRPSTRGGARAQRGEAMGGTQNNYYISGEWRFSSPADAVETAKKAARLASLGGERYAGMAATGQGYRR